MTHQNDLDPNRNLGRTPRDYVRRDDGSWSPVALVLGAVLLATIGWFALADRSTAPSDTTTTSSGQTNSGGSTKTPQGK